MIRLAGLLLLLATALSTSPSWAAKKKKEEMSQLPTHLLMATNQGALQKLEMPSMEICQSVAQKIDELDDAYGGPTLHIYCISDDGQVWAYEG